MQINDIQRTLACGAKSVASSLSGAAQWAGRSVQALGDKSVTAAKTVGHASYGVLQKTATVITDFLAKAGQLIQSGALNAWNFAKVVTNETVRVVSIAARAVFDASKTIGQTLFDSAKTVGSALLDVSKKTVLVVANTLSALGHNIGRALVAMKDGTVAGFQASRSFLVAHQKETLIAGLALLIGLSIGYAVSHYRQNEATA